MDKFYEVQLVCEVLSHPAGFNLQFAGSAISIRTTDQETIEVEWETSTPTPDHYMSFSVSKLREAAIFFVDKRHELEYGWDFDAMAFKKLQASNSELK